MATNLIIQARDGNTRLPGKGSLPIGGVPVIKRLIDRIKKADLVDKVIVAIPESPNEDGFADLLAFYGYDHFRGDENDVLKRVTDCAVYFKSDVCIEVTADCPLIDSKHIDFLITQLRDNDYVSNVVTRSWPDGCDLQVYTIDALKKVNEMVTDPTHRRHVGWNIFQNPDKFNIKNYPAPEKYHWPELGLTLDEPKDYKLFCALWDEFGNWDVSMETVIDFMRAKPNFVAINNNVRRNIPGVDG